MSRNALLRHFPVVRTRSPEEFRHNVSPIYAIRTIDVPDRGQAFDCVLNRCELSSMAISYSHYGSPMTLHLSQNDFFTQGFPLAGSGEVVWNGQNARVDHAVGGIVGGPGAKARLTYDGDFAHLVVKFSPATLIQKLSVLIDRPLDPSLELVGGVNANPDLLAGQFHLVRFLAEELDRADGPLPPIVMTEIEQAIVVAYLMAARHNYSHWLDGTPRAAAPWQVRRAVDYIEQHWDQPITIEALTQAAQTSARSLFHLFKHTHGVSPMVFVKQVRLRHARRMLDNPTPETSVTSVGFLCGFSNMGHFAKTYYDAFGERPSETLKARR